MLAVSTRDNTCHVGINYASLPALLQNNDNEKGYLGGCILNCYHPYLHQSGYILTYSGVVKVLANDYGIRCGACYCLAITMSCECIDTA